MSQPTSVFVLRHELRNSDPGDGRWTLRRTDSVDIRPERGDYLASASWIHPEEPARAHVWATRELYRHGARAVSWAEVNTAPGTWAAIVAPARDAWQITGCRDRYGDEFVAGRDGTMVRADGLRFATITALEWDRGPLTPTRVHNIGALLAEVTIFRAMCEYVVGPQECRDRECDDYADADGNELPARDAPELCSHLEQRVATVRQAIALDRVVARLEQLEAFAAPPPDSLLHQYSHDELTHRGGIRHAAGTIRTAINGGTDDE